MMSYTQLVQLARSELTGKGVQDSVVQQLQQTTQSLTRICADYETTTKEVQELRIENQKLSEEIKTKQQKWAEEKANLKRSWQALFNEICNKLGVKM